MAVYAVADLHGCYGVFEKGLEEVSFSADDYLYVIGDAVDRGPDGIKILQAVKSRENMELLIGNHEFMMLNSVDEDGGAVCNGEDSSVWLYANGGDMTFEKYRRMPLAGRRELLAWLRRCLVIKTTVVSGTEICLTHSYYSPECENKRYSELSYQDAYDVVWKSMYRDDFYTRGRNIYGDYGYLFVTGHVPVQRVMQWYEGDASYNGLDVFRKGNFIDIDGGLAMGRQPGVNNGALFFRLDDMKAFPVFLD